jgi:hypothetical protein
MVVTVCLVATSFVGKDVSCVCGGGVWVWCGGLSPLPAQTHVAPPPFGLVVSGRPVTTEFLWDGDKRWVIELPVPGLIGELAVFVLPGASIPRELCMCACVFVMSLTHRSRICQCNALLCGAHPWF